MKITGFDASVGDMAIARIARAVAAHCGVTVPAMLGEGRSGPVVAARQMAMALVHDMHGYTLKRIGRPFDRDHTTVLHSLRRVAERRAADAEYEAAYQAISVALTSMRDAA